MMTGFDPCPEFHQPRSGIPSLEVNSAGSTDKPASSGVFGPRSGNRNIRNDQRTADRQNHEQENADQRQDAEQQAADPADNE
jgi:hypothetical protein